jgi:hypothetical protein
MSKALIPSTGTTSVDGVALLAAFFTDPTRVRLMGFALELVRSPVLFLASAGTINDIADASTFQEILAIGLPCRIARLA